MSDYASANDLLEADDLPTQDMEVVPARGKPMRVTITALSFVQQQAIFREAANVAHKRAKAEGLEWGGAWDDETYYLATLEHGLLVPRLDRAQARALGKKRGRTVLAIAEAIWRLSDLDYAGLPGAVAAFAGAPLAPAATERTPPAQPDDAVVA